MYEQQEFRGLRFINGEMNFQKKGILCSSQESNLQHILQVKKIQKNQMIQFIKLLYVREILKHTIQKMEEDKKGRFHLEVMISIHSIFYDGIENMNLFQQSKDGYNIKISIRLWDVKTGQQKCQFDGHSDYVRQVCFSPDHNTLASGSWDNFIRLWDVKIGKEIQSQGKSYKDILAQFKTPLFQNNPLPESISTNITIVLISQTPIFQAQGVLVLQGEFINYQGVDLRSLLKSKGRCFLEEQSVFFYKKN